VAGAGRHADRAEAEVPAERPLDRQPHHGRQGAQVRRRQRPAALAAVLQLGQPSTLLGYPVTEDDNFADVGANAYPLAFGDFKKAYTIAEKPGLVVNLRDPYTNKPYVLFYMVKRVGGGVTNFEAFKVLKVATSLGTAGPPAAAPARRSTRRAGSHPPNHISKEQLAMRDMHNNIRAVRLDRAGRRRRDRRRPSARSSTARATTASSSSSATARSPPPTPRSPPIVKEGDVTGTMTSVADADLLGTEALAGDHRDHARTSGVSKNVAKRIGYTGGKRYVSVQRWCRPSRRPRRSR
jgi:hypothetical protein